MRLVFSSASEETALFTNDYRPPKKSNVLNFFDSLKGQEIRDIEMAESDRFIYMHFNEGTTLLFQLFGNHPNILRINQNTVTDSFKNPDKVIGSPPPEPRKATRHKKDAKVNTAKQKLLHFDEKLPRHLLQPIIQQYNLEDADLDECHAVASRLVKAMKDRPSFRVLQNGHLCLVPDELLEMKNEKVFDSVNDAVQYAYYKTSHLRRFQNKLSSIQPVIKKELKKKKRALRQLSDAEKTLLRAEQYEQLGHLLMANAHLSLETGQQQIEVTNFYQDNETQLIDIKPELSIAENAQLFYEKSTKAKNRIKESERREKEIKKMISQLEKLDESLEETGNIHELEEWEKNHQDPLENLNIFSKKQQKSSLPFRRAEVDGFEVWIGKNAKSNDELLKRAHKEDIWMHARGVPGSHVVIRMNNNSEFPPKHVTLRAASYAAWHSGARGSSLAPVMVTKQKYVTKPKGASPGSVRVRWEKVEMVSPKKP